MRIILEGPDGAGKSTLAKRINEHYPGLKIVPMRGTYPMDRGFLDDTLKLNNVIFDRHFVSENIYSLFYDKKRRITAEDTARYVEKCKRENIPIIILLPKDRKYGILETEDEDIKQRHKELVHYYESFCYTYGITPIETEEQALDINNIIGQGGWKK